MMINYLLGRTAYQGKTAFGLRFAIANGDGFRWYGLVHDLTALWTERDRQTLLTLQSTHIPSALSGFATAVAKLVFGNGLNSVGRPAGGRIGCMSLSGRSKART